MENKSSLQNRSLEVWTENGLLFKEQSERQYKVEELWKGSGMIVESRTVS
jgi:hypothetical protein